MWSGVTRSSQHCCQRGFRDWCVVTPALGAHSLTMVIRSWGVCFRCWPEALLSRDMSRNLAVIRGVYCDVTANTKNGGEGKVRFNETILGSIVIVQGYNLAQVLNLLTLLYNTLSVLRLKNVFLSLCIQNFLRYHIDLNFLYSQWKA